MAHSKANHKIKLMTPKKNNIILLSNFLTLCYLCFLIWLMVDIIIIFLLLLFYYYYFIIIIIIIIIVLYCYYNC